VVPAAQEIIAQDPVTSGDVALLARVSGPCITAIVSIQNPLEIEALFKNTIREMEDKLKETASAGDIPQLTQPVRDLAARAEAAGFWAQSIILFRSPDMFRCFLLPEPANEMTVVEERFQVRPLLSAVARERRFFLLALSKGNVRLFRCTQQSAEEEDLNGFAPRDIRVWMGTWKPDHVLDNRAVAGPGVGSAKGVAFTTSRDKERHNEYLAHFYKDVDRGIDPILRGDGAPLILAGVEEEIVIYRQVNTYPRLVEKAVTGSPDGMNDHLLQKLGREIAGEVPSEPLAKTLARFERYRDSARVSADVGEIIPAVWDGRVADFVFSRNAEVRGVWTPDSRRLEIRDDGEDLLNATALWTMQRGGQAFALRRDEMPVGAEVAAVFRF
jgi:hypothetical protein